MNRCTVFNIGRIVRFMFGSENCIHGSCNRAFKPNKSNKKAQLHEPRDRSRVPKNTANIEHRTFSS